MAVAPPDSAAGRARGPRLEWDGKRTQVERIELPFQLIENVNEPRQKDMFSAGAAQQALASGWRNKLIWGDNKLACAALLKQFEGKIDLIYIDPPFDTGADFSFRVSIGDESIEKQPSILETKAYYDTWGHSTDSYLQMLYDRLALMRELLSERGTIYVHVGADVPAYVRVMLDELFGRERFVNEIIWKRQTAHSDIGQGARHLGPLHDTLLLYTRSENFTWNMQYQSYSDEYVRNFYKYEDPDGRRYRLSDATGPGGQSKGNPRYEFLGVTRYWRFSRERMQQLYEQGRIVQTRPGAVPAQKRYLDEMPGVPLQDIWDDIPPVQPQALERLGYDTQKPEALLDRIIRLSSNAGDLVADFFCGSGTTVAVAERLERRWVGADLGRFAIHTSRKRLLDIPGCKPFEVLNLGKYERQYWQGVTTGRDDSAYIKLVLKLYRAQPNEDGTLVHGLKAGVAVHVGPIDAAVTVDEARGAVEAAVELGYKRLHILGWEWQMGLKETAVDEALARGIQLSLKRIPSEIMDPRAREKGDVEFFEMNHVDATADIRGRSVQIFLDDFIIADLELVKPEIQDKIERFSDYIDYWAVDFDFRDDTFHNQWQSFRTRKQPKLELESMLHTYDSPGLRDVLVKVIDIFGNDTTKLIKVNIQ